MNETKKMMEIIHQNCKAKRIENEMIKKESEKRSKRTQRRTIALLLIVAVGIFALGMLYNESQIKGCMEQGNSETFCRYAGE